MNRKNLLSAALLFITITATAQESNVTYAITGSGNGNFNWTNIRQVDIGKGTITKLLFENGVTPVQVTDALSKKPAVINNAGIMGYGVAAAALDKIHNRLYFVPMHIADLRYLDLNSADAKFVQVSAEMIKPAIGGQFLTEESHITRMVIGADGYGYAITNDANHLIRFTTGKTGGVTDLGNLVDAESNNLISVHNKCSSWGGDVIADAYGKLYVISASHNIFKVDVDTRIATHIGTITGLPGTFTTNGAAVDADGKIVVCSATVFAGYYKFDIGDLKATLMEGSDKTYNASDLANGNLLFQKEADAAKSFGAATLKTINPENMSSGHVFPNPVTTSEFKVSFEGMAPGKYTVTLADVSGRPLQNNVIVLAKSSQVETIKMVRKPANGMYLVKVTDENKKTAFTERVVIQ